MAFLENAHVDVGDVIAALMERHILKLWSAETGIPFELIPPEQFDLDYWSVIPTDEKIPSHQLSVCEP